MDGSALAKERERRRKMWEAVQRIRQERPLVAKEVNGIGCYHPGRGIWRDKKLTSDLTSSGSEMRWDKSSGKYEDDIDEEIGTYDANENSDTTKETSIPCVRHWSGGLYSISETPMPRRVGRVEFEANEFPEDDPISGAWFRLLAGVRRTTSCLGRRGSVSKRGRQSKRRSAPRAQSGGVRAAVVWRYGGKRCALFVMPHRSDWANAHCSRQRKWKRRQR